MRLGLEVAPALCDGLAPSTSMDLLASASASSLNTGHFDLPSHARSLELDATLRKIKYNN